MRKLVVVAVATLMVVVGGTGAADAPPVEPTVIPLDPETLQPVAAEAEPTADAEPTAATAEDVAAYKAAIKDLVAKVRAKVLARVTTKLADKQGASMGRFSTALFAFSFAGLFLLLMPFALRRRYPGKGKVLFQYSALAAGAFFVSVNLFAVVLLLQRAAQAETAALTNPQVAITTSALDVIDAKAGDLAGLALTDARIQQTVEGSLLSLVAQAEDAAPTDPAAAEPVDESQAALAADVQAGETLPVLMLRNVQVLLQDVRAFKSMASAFKNVSWVFGYLPILLTALGLILFIVGLRPILTEIVTMPGRAASGELGAGRALLRNTLRRLVGQLIATLCGIGVLFVTAYAASVALVAALPDALEAFMAFLFLNLMYVFNGQEGATVSTGWIYVSLGLTAVFLVLNIAVLMIGTGMFFGKVNKIFAQRFVDRVPLGAHRRFWIWGTLSYAWLTAFPVLYALAGVPLAKKVMDWTFKVGENGVESWPLALSGAPASLVLVFVVAFFALQGFRAVRFLGRYKVVAPRAPLAQLAPRPADFWSPPAAA